MSQSPSEQGPPQSSAPSVAMWLAFAVLAAAIFALWMMKNTPHVRQPSGLVGLPAPEIRVEGWLNGPGPTNTELRGKVVVIDAWAFWCGPCLRQAPHVIELHNRYKDRVVFLGLTSENSQYLEQSKQFIAAAKWTWPQGYGAVETLEGLEANYIPRLYVIGRDGRLAWDDTSEESIEEALDREIAVTPSSQQTSSPAETNP